MIKAKIVIRKSPKKEVFYRKVIRKSRKSDSQLLRVKQEMILACLTAPQHKLVHLCLH